MGCLERVGVWGIVVSGEEEWGCTSREKEVGSSIEPNPKYIKGKEKKSKRNATHLREIYNSPDYCPQ